MFEKVNPKHPDKIADRIAGAIVDLAYKKNKQPKVACEVLIGHGTCHIINETDTPLEYRSIVARVHKISGQELTVDYKEVKQDKHLAKNQEKEIRCGDNGIFKGVPITSEQHKLSKIAREIYKRCPYDGKYIISENELIICQSHANKNELAKVYYNAKINPIGDWTGGTDVDTGATNRKLGSDMGDAVTGGGLHGKDLSKADVSVNIYLHTLAQKYKKVVKGFCAIGDGKVKIFIGGHSHYVLYSEIVETARKYIKELGGFEKLAEWGLL